MADFHPLWIRTCFSGTACVYSQAPYLLLAFVPAHSFHPDSSCLSRCICRLSPFLRLKWTDKALLISSHEGCQCSRLDCWVLWFEKSCSRSQMISPVVATPHSLHRQPLSPLRLRLHSPSLRAVQDRQAQGASFSFSCLFSLSVSPWTFIPDLKIIPWAEVSSK